MKSLITRFLRDEEGQDIVEYLLLIVFIGLLVALGMQAFSTALNTRFTNISTSLS